MSGWPAALVALFSLLGSLLHYLRDRKQARNGSPLEKVARARERARDYLRRRTATRAADDDSLPDDERIIREDDGYRRD